MAIWISVRPDGGDRLFGVRGKPRGAIARVKDETDDSGEAVKSPG